MDLLTQLNCAVEYIEAHITDEEALASVASVTSYSAYHFARIFNYIADMPLGEYIRRRKMSLAAVDLQSGKDRVIDIAVKYGYDSADSFARAFAKQHSVMPSEARNSGVAFEIYPPIAFQIKIKGVQKMNFRMEEKKAFEVFGIERIFSNNETGEVPAFWDECRSNGEYERLFRAAKKEMVEKGNCIIGAACGYCEAGNDSFPYMICAVKDEDSDTAGFKIAQIPEATWAVFRSDDIDHIGTEIPTLFRRAYSEWLPYSGYDKANGPDLEVYGLVGNGKYYEEVWIPVSKIS